MVTPHSHVQAWVEASSALTHDDVASDDLLAAKLFHAETLSCTVASVLTGSLSFLWAISRNSLFED